MELNADFTKRVVVHADQIEWQASPMPGVSRRMLDRLGSEVARATSIVRYAPGSHFSSHIHTGGEEFLVLDGVFQDEHGDYPVGSYVRNPPQSRHTPGSEGGCTIFVKLWQFDMADRTQLHIDTTELKSMPDPNRRDVWVAPLFSDRRENVRLEIWSSGSTITLTPEGGMELLVLSGSLQEGDDNLVRNSWIRLPIGAALNAVVGPEGARLWVKTGHLRFVTPPMMS